LTIIAGFLSPDGVVICADTQETVGQTAKRHVPKLVFQPQYKGYGSEENFIAVFCRAGDGALVHRLVANAWRGAKGSKNLDEACAAIQQSVEYTYEDYGKIFQPGYCPNCWGVTRLKNWSWTRSG